MYNFLLNMWIIKKIDEKYLDRQIDKKRISLEEKLSIIATTQVI